MAVIRPGDYITAKCRRCNDVTGHVVMLVLDGEVSKVECKACGSVHKYRGDGKVPPKKTPTASVRHVRAGEGRDQAKDLDAPRSRAIGIPSTQPKPKVQKLSSSKIETAWQEAMVRHSADTPVTYSMKNSFEAGVLLEHPKFGRGEVISVTKPDKMEVLFQDGVKILRCTLE